jgi:hypothetical protein
MLPKPVEEARRVRDAVNHFYQALIRARDAFLPSARVHLDKTRGRYDSGFDTAVIGFWGQPGKYEIVASVAGLGLISEIAQKGPQLMREGNTFRQKPKFRHVWDDFQEHVGAKVPQITMETIRARRLLTAVNRQAVQNDMGQLKNEVVRRLALLRRHKENLSPSPADRDGQEVLKDLREDPEARGSPEAFDAGEAEASMASYLMRQRVAGTVHLYGRWSPCGRCCRALHWLSYLYGAPGRRAGGAPPDNLRWQIGWVFYGKNYRATNDEKVPDFRSLQSAVALGGIAGFECLG